MINNKLYQMERYQYLKDLDLKSLSNEELKEVVKELEQIKIVYAVKGIIPVHEPEEKVFNEIADLQFKIKLLSRRR